MKLSSIMCASFVALAATALIADGAWAATSLTASKSNTNLRIDTRNPNAEKDCIAKGGTVTRRGARMGRNPRTGEARWCTMPLATTDTAAPPAATGLTGEVRKTTDVAPPAATTIVGSKSQTNFKTGSAAPASEPGSTATPAPAGVTTIKTSKSNSSFKTGSAAPASEPGSTATPAPAGVTTANTSKSNTYKIGTAAGTTEADCTKKGGSVTTDKDGAKLCTMPQAATTDAAPPAATTVSASKSNSSFKTGSAGSGTSAPAESKSEFIETVSKLDAGNANAASDCTKKGGAVTTDKDGVKWCTMPKAASAPATPAPSQQ